jgi:regulator of nonsense transcripts 1
MADGRRSGTPSRFDANFYRTHDALSYIPSDVQSLRSQATYASGLPMFGATGPFGPGMPRGANGAKRSGYGSYASSIISQDAGPSVTDSGSVIGSTVGTSDRAASAMAYSQSDRLRRRSSFSSVAGASDVGSMSQYEYRSQDEAADMDDMKSQYAGTQAGVTVF